MDQDLMLIGEVSEMLRTPVDTLRQWRMRGEGPSAFKVGRRLLYRRSAVLAWLEEQEREQVACRPRGLDLPAAS